MSSVSNDTRESEPEAEPEDESVELNAAPLHQWGALLRADSRQLDAIKDELASKADEKGESFNREDFDVILKECKELTKQAVGFEHFQKFLKSDYAKDREEKDGLGSFAVPEIGNKQKNKGKGKQNKKPSTLAAEVEQRMEKAKELFGGDQRSACQANIMASTARAYLTLDKDDIMDILGHATCAATSKDVVAEEIVDDAFTKIPAKYKNPAAAGGRRRETFARRAAEFQRSRIASILQSMR